MKLSAKDLLYVMETGLIRKVLEGLEDSLSDYEKCWDDRMLTSEEDKHAAAKILILYQEATKLYNKYTFCKKSAKSYPDIQKICDNLGLIYEEETNI
jgi:hypothetical protein